MHKMRRIAPFILLLIVVTVVGVWLYNQQQAQAENGALAVSGTIETVEVAVASETGGRVVEVLAAQGEQVSAGQVLLRLDGELLLAQRRQAASALEAARAALGTAQAGLSTAEAAVETARLNREAAQARYELELSQVRLAESATRTASWSQAQPEDFSLPAWYFQQGEQLAAAQVEVENSTEAVDAARQKLNGLLDDELREIEERLSTARFSAQVAQEVLTRAQLQGDADLEAAAQASYDEAASELQAAQAEFDSALDEDTGIELQQARAELALAEERRSAALMRRDLLLTGEQSPRMRVAALAIMQAEQGIAQAQAVLGQAHAAVQQAEKGVVQAETALDLLDLRLKQLTVLAPLDGVVLVRMIQPGEILQPGTAALTLGQLDSLTITVYVPEDRYGEISLGETAAVTVDSFPGRGFSARVSRIADQAEFTPRNVQTKEGRRTTVFAVELTLDDPEGLLKPGMPADVTFEQ